MPQRTDLDLQSIITEYQKGKSASQLAKDLGCSVWSILNRLRKAGVDIRTETQNEVRIPDLTQEKRDKLTELVDGILLGDGSIDRKGFLRIDQTEKTWGWVSQLTLLLDQLGVESKTLERQPHLSFIGNREIQGNRLRTLYTRSYKFMKEQRDRWYPDGTKILPLDLRMTPVVLAHWFCGDGTYDKTGSLAICTNNFTHSEVCRLSILLKVSLGVHSNTCEQRPGQWTLRISRKKDAVRVRDLVRQHIPECFQYKFRYVRDPKPVNKKLTDDQVREIREIRDSTGMSYEKIALQFGVRWTTIHKICTRETYKHIP